MSCANCLLQLQDINYAYHTVNGETQALTDISFDVEDGEFVAIVGPSGCGKSTLLSLIANLIQPESGSICVHSDSSEDAHTNIGYMLQKDHLFEWRNVYRNVTLGLEIQHKLTDENKAYIESMLKTYGLHKFKHSKPSELSGGMRQRAALIRTLAMKPDLLLLDEPFSALDYQTRLSVCDDIGSIIRKEHKTAILVTHDLSEAISLGDKIVVLSKRPATVQKIVPVAFEEENLSLLERRNAPEFKQYFNLIWKELNSHG